MALARRIRRGDKAARDHMISANLRLVVKIAHDYKDFGLPLLDLISEGNIGLMKAVERFDPHKGGKLSTYAAWWIKQSIKRALANQSKTIRLPVHLVDKISKMRRTAMASPRSSAANRPMRSWPRSSQIPTSKVAHLKSVSVRPTSLDAPIGEEATRRPSAKSSATTTRATRSRTLRERTQNRPARDGRSRSNPRSRDHPPALRPRRPRRTHARGGRREVRGHPRTRPPAPEHRALEDAQGHGRERAQRTVDEIEQDERQRKRMEVIREFVESQVEPITGEDRAGTDIPKSISSQVKGRYYRVGLFACQPGDGVQAARIAPAARVFR